jgi:hypothetical protein
MRSRTSAVRDGATQIRDAYSWMSASCSRGKMGTDTQDPGDAAFDTKANIARAGITQSNSSDHHAAENQWNLPASVLVLDLRATPFHDIAHILENEDRKRRHALPLFGTERLVEWLPRFGEFIQIG